MIILLGLPGSGKTTLASHLIGTSPTISEPWTSGQGIHALGRFGPGAGLGGVDWVCQSLGAAALSVSSILTEARALPGGVVVLDNVRFDLGEMITSTQCRCILLDVGVDVCSHRRAMRGSRTMDNRWWSRRLGVVQDHIDIANQFNCMHVVDGELTPGRVADAALGIIRANYPTHTG